MPRGPRKLTVRFGTTSLTHYGGAYLLHRFLSRIGFKETIARHVRVVQRNNRYSVGEMLLALLYPMILGLERIDTTQLLRQNGVFQYLTGLPSYPEATTLRRFLLRVAPTALPKVRALHDRFLRRMSVQPRPPTRLIFDVVRVLGDRARLREAAWAWSKEPTAPARREAAGGPASGGGACGCSGTPGSRPGPGARAGPGWGASARGR
jgi:hypothetical protein